MSNSSRNHIYLFPLGKRILAIRAVSSGTSGNFWGCRDIVALLLLSASLLASSLPSLKYPSFPLSLSMLFANRVLNERPPLLGKKSVKHDRGYTKKYAYEEC